MQTFRELVYMVMDELKLHTDDASFTEDHIIFLLVKYRAFLLKQRYSDIKKMIPESNYQDICLNLLKWEKSTSDTTTSIVLKSNEEVPLPMQIGIKRVYADNYYEGEITYTFKDRMKYTGYNKYLTNILYCSIGPDNHLIFKGPKEKFDDLSKVHFYCIFQDCAKASDLSCDNDVELLDRRFPIEDNLIPNLVELSVKELLNAEYRPKDDINDASDNLSDLASFLKRNTKSSLAKQLE